MLKYLEFLLENKDNENIRRNQRISSFKDFNDKDLNFVKSLYGEEKIKDQKFIRQKYDEWRKFRIEDSDYLNSEAKYKPLFFKMKERDGLSDQELMDIYKEMQPHKNTIKQYNFDLTELEDREQLEDELDKIKLVEKTNKFIKLLPSHIRNPLKKDKNKVEKFSEMLIGYSYEDYKNTFLKKVSKYRTVEEFFGALSNHLKSFAGKSAIFDKLESHPGVEIAGSSDDFIVARIYSRKASSDLGSQQWCISNRGGSYWNSYVCNASGYGRGERPGVQYFIWDFRYDPIDPRSLIGATVYNDDKITSHDKSDRSFDPKKEPYSEYLDKFDELTKSQKIRLVANNPSIEEYTGIVNSLDDKEKRKMLEEIPQLLLHFKDLSFLSNEEIWELVKRDRDIAEAYTVAMELTDDQKIQLVIKNPDLLEKEYNDGKNPYLNITNKLNSKQKLVMITNKHKLYPKFENSLTEDELFDLIDMDPKIMVSYSKIAETVDKKRLTNLYKASKERWDKEIGSMVGDAKTTVELLLTHLTKDESRLDMEDHNYCFMFVAEEKMVGDKKYLIFPEREIIYVKDILSPQNQKVGTEMLKATFEDELNGYSAWIPKELINLGDLDDDSYIFKSSMEDLINGNAVSETEQQIYDSVIKTHKRLDED